MLDIDVGVIKAILREGTGSFYAEGLGSELIHGRSKVAFNFIEDHYRQYGILPKEKTVLEQTGVDVKNASDEPMGYWAEFLKNRFRFNLLNSGLSEIIHVLERHEIKKACELLKALCFSLDSQMPLLQKPRTIFDIDTLLPYYEKLESKIIDIPTPWPTLTKRLMGFQPEDLTTIVAKSGVGKTFLLILILLEAWKAGKKVLLVSTEMKYPSLMMRCAAFVCKLSYSRMRSGELSSIEKNLFTEVFKELKHDNRFILFGEGFDVSFEQVESVLLEYKPALVGIDGAYLLSSVKIKSYNEAEKIAQVWTQLKSLAKRNKVPIVAISQMNRDYNKSKKMDTDRVAFSDNIVRLSDNVFLVTKDEKDSKKLTFVMGKMRESDSYSNIDINWDLDNVDFSEIPKSVLPPSL